MPIDPKLLTLTQWLSPVYPVGAFSYSHGLEWAAHSGDVTDSTSLHAWVETALRHGAGRSDALILAAAYHAETASDLARVDAQCRAFAPSAERLRETELLGAAFCTVTAAVWGVNEKDLTYPVAVGNAARHAEIDLGQTLSLFLHAFVANLVAAGQRLAAVGQTDAQRIVRELAPACAEIATDSLHGDLEHLSSSAFLGDIASMRHETQTARIFRT